MDDFHTIIRDKRRIKNALDDYTIEQVQAIIEKFQYALDKKTEEQEAAAKEQQALENKLETIKKTLEEQNIPLSILLDALNCESKPKKVAKPKYRFTDNNGEIKLWSGRGHMPKHLKQLVESGQDIESFRIES